MKNAARGIWAILISLWISESVYGQLDSTAYYLEKIIPTQEDSLRLAYAVEIGKFLEQVPYGSYDQEHPVKYLSCKQCTGCEAEMYSWVVPLQHGQAFYHLFKFKNNAQSYYLESIPHPGRKETNAWLFYDWLAFERQGEMYYVLLGWNKEKNVNKKTIRIARLEEGKISFGYPFIRKGNQKTDFLDFEYAGDGSMMLKQDRKGKRIIFDHLAPNDPKYEGYYMFYGPDGSYDALEWKGEEWVYIENAG